MDPDPYAAIMDALGEQDYDEIIISTHPETRSGWLREGLVDRVRRAARRPVEHVVVDLDAERDDVKRTLVVANQTVASAELLDLLRRKAEEEPRRFIVICPQSGDENGRAGAAERLAHTLKELEDAGLEAIGQVVHPDPYTAIQNALQFYAPDDIVISTFPETRSGWLRERPDRARARPRPASRSSTWSARRTPDGAAPDGSRRARRPRRAPRPARGQRLLAGRGPVPRDAAFHHLGDHALRSVLHGLLLHPGRGRGGLAGAGRGAAGRDRRGEHRDPAVVELHDALGARGRAQREPARAEDGPADHRPARPHVPDDPGQRVRPPRLRAPATTPRARSSTGSPACTAPTCSSGSRC